MNLGSNAKESLWHEALLLATFVAISYFLFQLLLIFSAVSLDSCLYEFWSPHGPSLISLHGLFLLLVSLFLLWSAVWCVRAYKIRNLSPLIHSAAFGTAAVGILLLWLRALLHMHRAFAYERGELSAELWFTDQQLFTLQVFGTGICNALLPAP